MDLEGIDQELDVNQLRVYVGTLMSIVEIIKLDKNMSMDRLISILLHNAKEGLNELKGTKGDMNERH
jgi:hypothetical protein